MIEISDITNKIDIIEYISQFCDLELRGDGDYWGCSPFKEENTPSFHVSPDKQKFYCFSTGRFGDVLDFVQIYFGVSKEQGIRMLMNYAGISEGDMKSMEIKRLASTSIAKRFKSRPQKNIAPVSVLADDYMNRYDWDESAFTPWLEEGITLEALKRFGVKYDPFSDRLVYPIINEQGKLINVCGRTLDPLYKEHKVRKYTYFSKFGGAMNVLYNLFDCKQDVLRTKEVIIFEGAKSCMKAYSWGFKNCCALLTSHLSDHQFKALIKLGASVVFALDAEVDIREDKNIKRLIPYVPVYWIKSSGVVGEKDSPTDKGEEVFRKLYGSKLKLNSRSFI